MIISLTGFMGCGKSSVGRELATLLSCAAVDLDGVIEQRSGRKIPEIFEADSEATFRKLELEALRDILNSVSKNVHSKVGDTETESISNKECNKIGKTGVDLILSLGGGTLTTPECAELVREKTVCIYLRASIDTLVENLEEDGVANRPMLSGKRSQNSEHPPIGTEQSPQQEVSQLNGTQSENTLRNRITELMNVRAQGYEKTAHHIIDIDGETPSETAVKIATTTFPKGFHQNREQAKSLRGQA